MSYMSDTLNGLQFCVDRLDRAGTITPPPPKSPARLFFLEVSLEGVAFLPLEQGFGEIS